MLYALTRMMPSDYVDMSTAGNPNITAEQKQHLRELFGFDKGVFEGYFSWAGDVIRGDLGVSLTFRRPVADIIKESAPVTFSIAFIALVLEFAVAVPLGVLAAKKALTKTDHLITIITFIGISLPIFFFAVLLKYIFSSWLGLLPMSGLQNARITYDGFSLARLVDYARHLILPIACFVITSAGELLRYTRAGMLEALGSDYVRAARARGLPERTVVYGHAFRNALIPIITMLGATLPGLFCGAAVTEGIFSIDGLGSKALTASFQADIPYLMGFCMFISVLTLAGMLLSDILYAVADPRVRYS